MSGYRNDLEAAQRRIDTLEAQLGERDASLKARRAEIAELENKIRRTPLGRARAHSMWAAAAGGLLTALVAGGIGGVQLGASLQAHWSSPDAASGGMDRPDAVVQVVEPPTEVSQPPRTEVIDPWIDKGEGTLVAIAIGGSCMFEVDGKRLGTKSSIRIKVDTGVHEVSCLAGGQSRTQRINVKGNRPGIASFRL